MDSPLPILLVNQNFLHSIKKTGKNQKEIAELLGVSPGTICRELKRNKGQKKYRRGVAIFE